MNTTIDINSIDIQNLPQPTKASIVSAHYKQSAEDFIVNEILNIDFSEEGEHLWLYIEKRGMNTTFVANALADWANISRRDVGYSGLKDRHAITRQWFSLRLPKRQLPATSFTLDEPEKSEYAKVLDTHWHNKKLNRGTHKYNEFILTLRDVMGDKQQIEAQLTHIAKHGVPNYFGEQRFGIAGRNIAQALEWFEHGTINGRPSHGKKNRDTQSILLSAARSLIFNQILAARIVNDTWQTGMDGDAFNLNGSGSIFATECMDETLKQRLAEGDIHPTAVMWGKNNDKVQGSVKDLEQHIVASSELLTRLANGIENQGIKASRRALRLPLTKLTWQWQDDSTKTNETLLVLNFCLPTGSYATSVLSALIK
ncbi:tRNA pseudouridine(13) synthase TruD [Psychrobacter sp. I-STPA10]|uniref:tRNA pseudouridine(13) synthase TruD n=1 Tax=Psychrobacter sp. I-STPA10 TaxID=2585769 RepID=UPI001E32844A|nr:tRNA pseudouridine(13) synthase TruD [Psychrobacter sp. I-STPA10]